MSDERGGSSNGSDDGLRLTGIMLASAGLLLAFAIAALAWLAITALGG